MAATESPGLHPAGMSTAKPESWGPLNTRKLALREQGIVRYALWVAAGVKWTHSLPPRGLKVSRVIKDLSSFSNANRKPSANPDQIVYILHLSVLSQVFCTRLINERGLPPSDQTRVKGNHRKR